MLALIKRDVSVTMQKHMNAEISDFKSKFWEDRLQKPLDDNSNESKPSAKIKPNIRIIPIR